MRRYASTSAPRFVESLPQMQVSFEAGDIVSQVMSFGSPTPVEYRRARPGS